MTVTAKKTEKKEIVQQIGEVDIKPAYEEVVVEINRISRTVKGGRRIRFRATVLSGNKNGRVGLGVAKAAEVQVAVAKATTQAKKKFINVKIINGTISHPVQGKHGGASIILRPAGEGTSIIAGGSMRPVLELAGIKNILAKSLKSANKINNILATIDALKKL